MLAHRLVAALLLLLNAGCVASERVLAFSDFATGMEGWSISSQPGSTVSDLRRYKEREHDFMPVEASDAGADEWYFRAPQSYLGDKSAAYGGYLEFILSWGEHAEGKYTDEATRYDVVLVSGNERIGRKEVVPSEISYRGQHRVCFASEAKWYHVNDHSPATKEDLLRVLGSLSEMLIRGSHYAGPEITHLSGVKLTAMASLRRPRLIVSRVSTYTVPVLETNYKDGEVVYAEPIILLCVVWNIPFPAAGRLIAHINDKFPIGEFQVIGIGSHGDSFSEVTINLQGIPMGEHYVYFFMQDNSARKVGIEKGLWIDKDTKEEEGGEEGDERSQGHSDGEL